MRKALYTVLELKKIRVVIDTDAACECDDQAAIVHALMSAKVDVVGITAEHFGTGTVDLSLAEINKVLDLCGVRDVPVFKGNDGPIENGSIPSPGAKAIVTEANKKDVRPLFVLCQGALTNLAQAIMYDPKISDKLVAIFVGGVHYPRGGFDFNALGDVRAFNIVMKSAVPVWMIPEEVYSTMNVSIYELYDKAAGCGRIGKYLYDKTLEQIEIMTERMKDMPIADKYEKSLSFPNCESWSMGDSAAIGILLSHNSGIFEWVDAPLLNPDGRYYFENDAKKVKMYRSIHSRFILDDFFSKLKYYFCEC